MQNPIDKDKVAEYPGLLPYPHSVGGVIIKPEDRGLIKSRALSAMQEQTAAQLAQVQLQLETLLYQANEIRERIQISEKIYQAEMRFEPLIGHTYHLYESNGLFKLMMIGPDQWTPSASTTLRYISTVKLLSDHTWQIINNTQF